MEESSQPQPTEGFDTYWGSSVYVGEPPWRLNWNVGGGYFAIGTRDFAPGDCILKEHPTTWTRAWHPFSQADKETIQKDVDALPPAEKGAFYAMSNMYPEEPSLSAGIYMTNSFDMPDYNDAESDEPQHASGMFLAIGRLNHSCLPNAQQTYIPKECDPAFDTSKETGYEVLYATRAVAAGEELCDCYIELRQNTEARRKELLKHYRFVCTCPACGPEDDQIAPEQILTRKENDARRARALKLEQDMVVFAEMGEVEMATDLGVELVKLLEHPKSVGWGERYIAEACVNTSTLFAEQNQVRKAHEYLLKAYEWNVRLQGEKSADSVSTAKKLVDLKASMMGKKRK